MSKPTKVKKMFIVYDERAACGDPDEAMVLGITDTIEGAREVRKANPGSVIYKYDILEKQAKQVKTCIVSEK